MSQILPFTFNGSNVIKKIEEKRKQDVKFKRAVVIGYR